LWKKKEIITIQPKSIIETHIEKLCKNSINNQKGLLFKKLNRADPVNNEHLNKKIKDIKTNLLFYKRNIQKENHIYLSKRKFIKILNKQWYKILKRWKVLHYAKPDQTCYVFKKIKHAR